jgi:hypothetical protein
MSVDSIDPRFVISDEEYQAYLNSYETDGDKRIANVRYNTSDGLGTAIIKKLSEKPDYKFLGGVKERDAIINVIKGAAG